MVETTACIGTQLLPSNIQKNKRISIRKVENGFIIDPEWGEDKVFLTLKEALYEIEKLFV